MFKVAKLTKHLAPRRIKSIIHTIAYSWKRKTNISRVRRSWFCRRINWLKKRPLRRIYSDNVRLKRTEISKLPKQIQRRMKRNAKDSKKWLQKWIMRRSRWNSGWLKWSNEGAKPLQISWSARSVAKTSLRKKTWTGAVARTSPNGPARCGGAAAKRARRPTVANTGSTRLRGTKMTRRLWKTRKEI